MASILGTESDPKGILLQNNTPAQSARSSRFEEEVQKILKREGGYSNRQSDRGGETNFGISKRAHPNVDIKNLTVPQAVHIYKTQYWDYIGGDYLPSKIASVVFDHAVNAGQKNTVMLVQQMLGLPLTGKMNSATVTKLKQEDENSFVSRFTGRRKDYYRNLAANDPSQTENLKGWLNRADSTAKEVSQRILEDSYVSDGIDYSLLPDSARPKLPKLNLDRPKLLKQKPVHPAVLVERAKGEKILEDKDYLKSDVPPTLLSPSVLEELKNSKL